MSLSKLPDNQNIHLKPPLFFFDPTKYLCSPKAAAMLLVDVHILYEFIYAYKFNEILYIDGEIFLHVEELERVKIHIQNQDHPDWKVNPPNPGSIRDKEMKYKALLDPLKLQPNHCMFQRYDVFGKGSVNRGAEYKRPLLNVNFIETGVNQVPDPIIAKTEEEQKIIDTWREVTLKTSSRYMRMKKLEEARKEIEEKKMQQSASDSLFIDDVED